MPYNLIKMIRIPKADNNTNPISNKWKNEFLKNKK